MSEPTKSNAGTSKDWNWNPELPIPVSPIFSWPPKPIAALKWLASYWLAVSSVVIILGLAFIAYWLTQPAWADMQDLSLGWILQIWIRNLILIFIIAGGLHLWLISYQGQDQSLKYDPRNMARDNSHFTFRNQVWDNMFWSIASGVTVWTVFEVGLFWLAANGGLPLIEFGHAPLWSVLLLVLIPIWSSFHFYWIHRLLHWPPLYRRVHSLHHRNINIGPWSGISMHPVEHLLYFTSPAIHLILPSDPIHILFHFYLQALAPCFSHSGYEKLVAKLAPNMALGDFFHQLHHRYFECNYGTIEVPWDVWFGSFHNGTEEATKRVRKRTREMQSG